MRPLYLYFGYAHSHQNSLRSYKQICTQHLSLLNPRDKPSQRAFVPERLQKNHLMDLGTVHISGMQLPVPAREIYLAFIRRSFC